MGIRIDRHSRQPLIFFSMALMLVSLFTSRFLLSVSFILFLFLACFHTNFHQQLRSYIRNPFLLGMSFLFFIPFLSWFWTEDKSMWMRFARIKMPLFLFPLAFAGPWQLSTRQWKWLGTAFLFLVVAGCCWSLWQYVQSFHSIHEQYLRAKLIPTPLENDHVRYSLLVTVAIVYLVMQLQWVSKSKRWLPVALAIFLAAYLHILSARTGLLTLYIFFLLGVVYLVLRLKKIKWTALLIFVMLAMPAVAWIAFPTFQNRVRYNLYDLSNARQNKYVAGANDGNRILSLKAGWDVLQQHPFGAGGDVVAETNKWYDRNVPQMPEHEKLFPSSEPLMYAGFAGWMGLAAFVTCMLLPLFQKVKRNYFFWLVLNINMAFSFLFDIGLEAQFGVFIYAFIVLWWWKWLNSPLEKGGL